MKLMYGNTPVKSLNLNYFERDTNDATLQASDLQSGVTAYARGQKVVGTGKCFSFASYGRMSTNTPFPIPTNINVVEIASLDYPVRMNIELTQMYAVDFTTEPTVGSVIVDGASYDIKVSTDNNMINIICDKNIEFQMFYGKDEYI